MSKKVTYSDIVNALAKKNGISKQMSEAFVKALLSRLKDELIDEGKASLTNFGSFKVKSVAERQGKNPQTGDPIIIPAHNRVSFSPYKALREHVNAEYAHLESELITENPEDENEDPESEQIVVPPEMMTAEESPQDAETGAGQKMTETPEIEAELTENIDDEAQPEREESVQKDFEQRETEHEEATVSDTDSESATVMKDSSGDESKEKESKSENEREGKYTNVLASLAVLLLTFIAIASVWLLLDGDTKNNPMNGSLAQKNGLVQTEMAAGNANTATGKDISEQVKKSTEGTETGGGANSVEKDPPKKNASEEAQSTKVETPTPVKKDISRNEVNDQSESVNSESDRAAELTAYEVQEDEWYWVISEKLYGLPRFWPLLFQQNHTINEDPDKLFKRVEIQVPEMEGTAANPTKNDYRKLAEASMVVAKAYENAGKIDKSEEYAKFARKWERLGS